MALYPNFSIDTNGSEQQPIDDLAIDLWPNGGARGRSYITVGRYRWVIVHTPMSEADRATLKAFYDANRGRTDVSFVSQWDGVTYNNILITVPPKYDKVQGEPPFKWIVKLEMRQV